MCTSMFGNVASSSDAGFVGSTPESASASHRNSGTLAADEQQPEWPALEPTVGNERRGVMADDHRSRRTTMA